jgi:rhodanese-related sulfurtransferase
MKRIANRRWTLMICVAIFGCVAFCLLVLRSPFIRLFNRPSVETIGTDELQVLLAPLLSADQDATSVASSLPSDDFVLVDVRSEAETSVSVIPGAITKNEFEENAQDHTGKLIIAYCTVGVRSGDYTKHLSDQGWSAKNYEGSILRWIDSGLPLVTLQGTKTRRVHSYSDQYDVPDGYEQIVDWN